VSATGSSSAPNGSTATQANIAPTGTSVGGLPSTPAVNPLNGNGFASGTVNNQQVITGNQPLVGASAASSGQNSGSALTAGALSNGQTATVGAL
jgi:hypothetical protein